MRIGSLFSGYGGLDGAVQAALGGTVVWHCENDPAAVRLLAHHYPDVPNLGDITTVQWADVEPVDVLTGGFPCQDVSHAGRRKGLGPDTRSGLWEHMARAITVLQPRLVVIENVRGLLSARAHSDMEPCPWCLGDDQDRPALRALGAVLGDLAELGYDTRWCGVRAADAGAPHGRYRVFIVAHPVGQAGGWDQPGSVPPGQAQGAVREAGRGVGRGGGTSAQQGLERPQPAAGRHLPARGSAVPHPDLTTGDQRRIAAPGQAEGRGSRADAGRRDRASAADASGERHGRPAVGAGAGSVGRLGGETPDAGDQRERARQEPRDRSPAAPADTDDHGRVRRAQLDSQPGTGLDGAHWGHADRLGVETRPAGGGEAAADTGRAGRDQGAEVLRRRQPEPVNSGQVDWGQYAPAIHRWESVLGRPAPAPTQPGRNGQPRLSPLFVEWLMGLPAGHVTDVPGLSRNDQLKLLGNGVVPQQAALALFLLGEQLLAHLTAGEAA